MVAGPARESLGPSGLAKLADDGLLESNGRRIDAHVRIGIDMPNRHEPDTPQPHVELANDAAVDHLVVLAH